MTKTTSNLNDMMEQLPEQHPARVEYENLKHEHMALQAAFDNTQNAHSKLMILTGLQIKDLAEAAGLVIEPHDYTDELETEMTIIECPESGVVDDDGKEHHYLHVAYASEYPEEGTFPLGDEVEPRK